MAIIYMSDNAKGHGVCERTFVLPVTLRDRRLGDFHLGRERVVAGEVLNVAQEGQRPCVLASNSLAERRRLKEIQ